MTDPVAAPVLDASAAPAAGLAPVAVAAPAVVDAAPVAVVEAASVAPAAPEAPAAASPPVVAEPAAPVEAEAKPEAKAEEPAAPERPKTLLEKADEERAAKEADKAKTPDAEAKKPAEDAAKPAEAEAEAFTFELPKELTAAPEQMQEFGDLIRAAKLEPKQSGQKLLDMHAKAMETYAKNVADNQWKVWNELIETKDKEILADPIIGGSGHETAKAAVTRMRDLLVPEDRRASFTTFMNVTGAGSWPDFWHLLHRAAEIFDEPPMPQPGGKAPRDAHLQQPTGRFALMHDHPSSQVKRD